MSPATIDWKPFGDLLAVVDDPVRIVANRCAGVVGQPLPLEKASPDDFGGLRLRGHHHWLAQAVEHLLESLLVCLVVVVYSNSDAGIETTKTTFSWPLAVSDSA